MPPKKGNAATEELPRKRQPKLPTPCTQPLFAKEDVFYKKKSIDEKLPFHEFVCHLHASGFMKVVTDSICELFRSETRPENPTAYVLKALTAEVEEAARVAKLEADAQLNLPPEVLNAKYLLEEGAMSLEIAGGHVRDLFRIHGVEDACENVKVGQLMDILTELGDEDSIDKVIPDTNGEVSYVECAQLVYRSLLRRPPSAAVSTLSRLGSRHSTRPGTGTGALP